MKIGGFDGGNGIPPGGGNNGKKVTNDEVKGKEFLEFLDKVNKKEDEKADTSLLDSSNNGQQTTPDYMPNITALTQAGQKAVIDKLSEDEKAEDSKRIKKKIEESKDDGVNKV